MLELEHDAVRSLPSGLVACRLNGESAHIYALSPRSVYLRTPQICPDHSALTLALYQPELGAYAYFTPQKLETGSAQRQDGAVLTRFFFQDAACSAAILRALNSYARYLEIKSSMGAAAYAAYAVDYPEEEEEFFCQDLRQQRALWAASLTPLPPIPDQTELAVELNCPELYALYLAETGDSFLNAYASARQLPANYLPQRRLDRLYVGNPYCRHLFPSENTLRAIAEKAAREKIALTLVSAEMRAYSGELAETQLRLAKEWDAEIVVNDWGMLHRASLTLNPGKILLGTVLNRRRKDPRMPYKAGLKGRETLLARNSLNDPLWIAFLREMGVERFEFESCALPVETPSGGHSLHLPFYQTNMSLWCPMRALCLHGERGAQADANDCPHYCESNHLLYPRHLNLLGHGKALLALDKNISALRAPNSFDRWVLNF